MSVYPIEAAAYPQIEASRADMPAELYAALAKVQAELPAVKKTRTADVLNKEGRHLYSYGYADLADVSAAIMPLLGKNGLAFTTLPGTHDGKFGLMYWLTHASGGRIGGFYEIEQSGGIQIVGGRITYARRYCLCAVTGVAAEEDVDARGDGQQRRPRRDQRPADGDQAQQRTAQRRSTTKTPAAEATTSAPPPEKSSPASAAGQPPLPGEEPDTADDIAGTVTGPQLTKIAVLMGELGFGKDQRDDKLQAASRVVGRDLKSSKELSKNEASALIDTIERCGADWDKLQALLDAGEKPAT